MDNLLINSFLKPVVKITTADMLLCSLFGKKARWFQLHCFINLMICNIIKYDIYNLLYSPLDVYKLDKYDELYYIFYLHVYHMMFFKNTLMDYFHHVVFVIFGTIPIYYYYNYNVIRLATLSGCGIPGAIEYFTLSLVKHEKIQSLTQKTIMVNVYNYFRYPFSIFAASNIYYSHMIGLTNKVDNKLIFYTIFMITFNSGFFNKLTIENRIQHYLHNKHFTN